jgi:hypothetical protein
MTCGALLFRHVRGSEHQSDGRARFSGQALGIARSTLRYEVREKNEDELRLALIRLAKQYGRYSYRKVGQLLRMAGWCINHRQVERI